MLTVCCAHASFSRERREMLPAVLDSWNGSVAAVVCDSRRSAWHTVRAAWEEALELSGGRGHLLVAQDDFLMADGGAELVEGLCDRFPGRVMSFRWCDEVEAWAAPWLEREDACWLEVAHAWSGGCVAVPAKLVRDFLEWSVVYERVLRSIPYHSRDYVDSVLRHRDDFRLDLYLISRGISVWRCRWSLLHHLGDLSEVRMGVRPESREVNLVRDVAAVTDLPAVDDPRWAGVQPSCLAIPDGYRAAVEQLFGDWAGEVGLAHARQRTVLEV